MSDAGVCKCGHRADQHFESHGFRLECAEFCYCKQFTVEGDAR